MGFFYWIELLFGMEVAFDFLNKSFLFCINQEIDDREERNSDENYRDRKGIALDEIRK